MQEQEQQWDKLLKVRTSGRDDSNATQYKYPYEPTPYCVLERLANSGWIRKKNVLLDYGLGKEEWNFSCLIRPDVSPLELSMTSAYIRLLRIIRKLQYLQEEWNLF